MNDAAFLKLLASYEAALEAVRRTLTIAQTLTDAHRTGRRLPDVIIDAYATGLDRDAAQLVELRATVTKFKSWFRTH